MVNRTFARVFPAMLLSASCGPPQKPDLPSTIPPIAAVEPRPEASQLGCVTFWPEARYRSYAYDHIVHLVSRCHRVAACNVSTNVSPKVLVVAVSPGEELEVLTLRGSPNPDFTADVRCSHGTR
jgi:hypothetical protein